MRQIVDVRDREAGGRVKRHTPEAWTFACGQRRIFLVHGFNTPRDRAQNGYRSFEASLRERDPSLANAIVEVHWPGDERLPIAGPAYYAEKVRRAIEAAREIGRVLSRLKQGSGANPIVALVGHSLGCRLILEALWNASRQNRDLQLDKTHLFLMGAAVAVGVVEEEPVINDLVRRCATRTVFHSQSDRALKRFFVPGQQIAIWLNYDFRRVRKKTAVGLRGEPLGSLWTAREAFDDYYHEEYWEQADAIAEAVYRCLVPSRSHAKRLRRWSSGFSGLRWQSAKYTQRGIGSGLGS